MIRYVILSIVYLLFLTGCQSQKAFAPVSELSPIETIPSSGVHRVQSSETLYSIAWRYGMDYRELARINQIQSPYFIQVGQRVSLKEADVREKSVATSIPGQQLNRRYGNDKLSERNTKIYEPKYRITKWVWPVYVKKRRRMKTAKQGLDIFGRSGEAIYAVGPGKVVYAGNGLRSYGNLILIKHNSLYFSAYAHNRTLLVKEGMWVKRGQKIAEMGRTGTNKVMLHFEFRKAGKSLNPLKLLPRR